MTTAAVPPSTPDGPAPDAAGRNDERSAILLHQGMDAADLIAAAHRVRLLADTLDTARRSPPTDFGDGLHHAVHMPADGGPAMMTGLEKDDDPQGPSAHAGAFRERYEMNSNGAANRTFSLIVATHAEAPDLPRPGDSSAIIVRRLRRHLAALETAARRAAANEEITIPCAPSMLLARMVEALLPGRLPAISSTIVTRIHPDGSLTANLRATSPAKPPSATILRPAAHHVVEALCHPAGRLSATVNDVRTEYVIAPIRTNAGTPREEPDAMTRLRRIAELPDLGPDPFTDEFLALHRRLAR